MLIEARKYEIQFDVRFIERLGDGKDGNVFKTEIGRAVKFFHDGSIYRRELRAYQILRQRGIEEINGFQIPRLLRNDDLLRALEMSIVSPPFMLDFASAYTREEYARLAFSEEVLAERNEHWSEIFGERWATVYTICAAFTRETGLILLDLNPNNIKF